MTHPLGLFWKIISFLQYPGGTFVHIQAKGHGYGWLLNHESIYSFYIAHSTFTSSLFFCLSLIQHSAFNPLTYECGHKLQAFNTHLIQCPFGGQRIATYDAIQKSGLDVWREQWYAFTSKISLQANLYMTRED
jgi:hypothetical protein